MSQYRLVLKQRVDGQVQVTGIRVPKLELYENQFNKKQIKNAMERLMRENHIMVLDDIGIVEYG